MAKWATIPRSCTSCTLEEHNKANPVYLQAITSEWSLKILKACLATVLEATWMTVGALSPAIKNMLGIINKRPYEAVKVEVKAPEAMAPCIAPAAPASDYI